jgi:serine/threonine protein kinase
MTSPSAKEASLFNEARVLTADQRPTFLMQSCGADRELAARLAALLRIHDEDRSFLEHPAEALPDSREVAEAMVGEGPGAAIGAYKLLEEIGEGGFGKVFMADQEAPIRRTVAVKILKPGMDSASIVARFESERQALALMNHPNIAQILDGGTTRAGRPYFVMELVRGLPITDFCDRNQLPLNDRLMLFVSVCRAIQHAHYKGIIHRDIKPTNIMVALHDGVPVAKVIDFGIAKALEQKATDRTFTLFGQMIGTPAYMSPEQVEMSGLDIDTRTDVYALGVLFYELLTGTTPLDAAKLRAASYADLQRMIREDEPPRPSTRLSSLGDTATIVAGQRGAKPKHLAGRLAGDLDWIALKALEKDRNRRYASAESFADDVERYFRGEMIAARPASPWYRLRKFARRNRAPVAAALALSIGLLGGAAIATWQAIVATKAKDDALNSAAAEKLANEAATKAKDDALNSAAAEKLASEAATKAKDDALNSAAAEKLASEAATQAKETAEQKSAESEAAIRFLTARSLAAARPKGLQGGLGPGATLRDAIDASVPFIDKGFPKQPLVEARVRRMLGISYWHLGEHQKSIAQNELARVIFADKLGADDPEALGCLNDIAIGHALSGHFDAAVRINEELARTWEKKTGPNSPETLRVRNNLAMCYVELGRHDDAIRIHRENLELQTQALGPRHRSTLRTMVNLANAYGAAHRDADALALREKTLPLQKQHIGPLDYDTLMTAHNLGASYRKARRFADALRLDEETLAARTSRLGPNHPDTISSLWSVGRDLMELERGAEGAAKLEDCLKRGVGQRVHRNFPEVADLLLRHYEKARDAAGCRRTCDLWEKQARTDGDSLYQAAVCRAATALLTADREQTKPDCEKSMAWLTKAVAAGFADSSLLQVEPSFRLMRDRMDFQKLVADLESRSKSNVPRSASRSHRQRSRSADRPGKK